MKHVKPLMKIMNSWLFPFLFVQISTRGFGQNEDMLRFRGGLILGANASQVDGDNYAGYKKLGFNGGFIAEIPLSKMFFVSAEILYSQLGARSRSIPGIPLEFKWNLNYAQIPVLINFQDKDIVNFGAGFYYGRLVKSRRFIDEIEQVGPVSGLGRNDFSMVLNGEYFITPRIRFNARFSYSLFKIGTSASSHFINYGLFNNVVAARLMYVI